MEFAIIVPPLLMVLGGAADFGLLLVGKSQLANGLAQGVQFALATGPSVTGSAVQSMVQNGASRAGLTATVSVSTTGPACYCTSGTPVALASTSTALSGSYTCTATCTGGATAGAYIIISASYTYQPLMPLYSQVATTTVSESVKVRLK